jgi:transposase
MPPPGGIVMCHGGCADDHPKEEASMEQATIIGIDLAKRTFQLHGAAADGSVVFRKKLPREKVLLFLAAQPPAVVAMEACGSAHHWGREVTALGHTVKLMPPIYVKPFVKRQKNDMADAEAIAEAASRPTRDCRMGGSSRSRRQNSRARACCSAHGISWCANERSRSTP